MPTTTAADLAAAFAWKCEGAKQTGEEWWMRCPTHDDHTPSLSVTPKPDWIVVHCFAGCDTKGILDALGLTWADLYVQPRSTEKYHDSWEDVGTIIGRYDYTDAHGTLLHQTVRFLKPDGDKTMRQHRPHPIHPGRWLRRVRDITQVLYHLPAVIAAIASGELVYLVEGEKDADSLEALGLTATTNPAGVKSWKSHYDETLRGAHLVCLPDFDPGGQQHMANVATRLHGIAASIKLLTDIHTAAAKSDVSDWLAEGHTRAELEAAVAAAGLWTPTPLDFKAAAPPATNGMHPPPAPNTAPPLLFDPSTMYTDTYNARAFADDHWLNVRYCSAWKTWLLWNGTHWERDDDGTVVQWAKQTIKDLAKLLHGMDNDQSKSLLSHIARSLSTAKLDAMLKSARSEPGIPIKPEAFDRNLWLLNCANGTIDLHAGTLRQAARDDYLTRCLSVKYNKQATCPTWEGFLKRVMGDKQGLVAFLHRAIGYSLTGSTMEQCLFILHGPTKTGKSTFLNRLRALLGPYATAADMESFMHKDKTEIRNDLADLAGARVVCALEAQEGKRLNESLIKQLTGGVDQVKARFLFQDYFTYTPQFKVFLGTNHKPVIKDNDQAIWERIRLVPFIVQIPKNDRRKTFDAELHQEIEGILAWAVRGCLDWQKRGDLEPPPEVINATKEYQEESDVIGRFIADKCVKLTQAETRANTLWTAYKDWCEQHGETWVKQTAFGRKLSEDGFGKRESHGIIYTGIGLRSEDQE